MFFNVILAILFISCLYFWIKAIVYHYKKENKTIIEPDDSISLYVGFGTTSLPFILLFKSYAEDNKYDWWNVVEWFGLIAFSGFLIFLIGPFVLEFYFNLYDNKNKKNREKQEEK